MITQPYYHLLRASGPEGTVQIPNGRPRTKVIIPKPAIKQGTTAWFSLAPNYPFQIYSFSGIIESLGRFPRSKAPFQIFVHDVGREFWQVDQ